VSRRLRTPPKTILVRWPTGDVPLKGERKDLANVNFSVDETVLLTVKTAF
jgi:hypothetical protein